MSCVSRLNLCPASGDTENVLLQKILQSLNASSGDGGGVTSVSLNGGPAQTGAVSITTPSPSAPLLNFKDANGGVDAAVFVDSGVTEVARWVGTTGTLTTLRLNAQSTTILGVNGADSFSGGNGEDGIYAVAGNGGIGSDFDGGNGGSMTLTAGNGGESIGAGNGGDGGNILITPGLAGVSGTGGTDGEIFLQGTTQANAIVCSESFIMASGTFFDSNNLFFNNTTLAFFNVAGVVKQTSGANLTNNVTAGGTDNTIANFTDLAVYANDAAAIRNDIYQLARKLKQINDGLRAYGLFT